MADVASPVPSAPSLAIVVCTRDRAEMLASTLAALVGQTADEVLVVDSASKTDATARVVASAGLRYVRVGEPGLARARNAGLRATRADVVAFTDDDCEPQPGWTDAVRRGFAAGPAFVLGRVVPIGGRELPVVQLDRQPRSLVAGQDPMSMGHGANFAVARAAWEQLRGFDELLGVGASFRAGEDIDFVWRALHAGWQGRYEPEAVVGHRTWRGRAESFRAMYGYGVGQGAVATKVRRIAGRDALRPLSGGTARKALRRSWLDLRAGYEFGALAGLGWAAGALQGQLRAALLAMDEGHLCHRGRLTARAP